MRQWIVLVMALSLWLGLQGRPAFSSETEGSHRGNFQAENAQFILETAAEAVRGRLQALDQDLARAAQEAFHRGLER